MRRSSGFPRLFALIFLFWLLPGYLWCPVWSQELTAPAPEEVEEARALPLFTSHETIRITVEADFAAMKRHDRIQDSEERPAILRWQSPSGTMDTMAIQVQTRGNFRLQKRNCEFPPLRLNLKKEATSGTVFQGQDKLKMVVVCKPGQDYWEQYVLLEYLAYRTFNLITDISFRARLVRVTYVDTSGDEDPFTRYAILLEDDDTLALRAGGRKVDWTSGQLHPRDLEPGHAVLVDLFQYMIGNTDWSGVEMHNMELIQGAGYRYYTVPYDFDFSGLVNARYATPDPRLPIRRVRQRLYRGFCPEDVERTEEPYQEGFQRLREVKAEIYALWRNQEGLERDRLEESLEYFDEFYETLENPDRLRSEILEECRRVPR